MTHDNPIPKYTTSYPLRHCETLIQLHKIREDHPERKAIALANTLENLRGKVLLDEDIINLVNYHLSRKHFPEMENGADIHLFFPSHMPADVNRIPALQRLMAAISTGEILMHSTSGEEDESETESFLEGRHPDYLFCWTSSFHMHLNSALGKPYGYSGHWHTHFDTLAEIIHSCGFFPDGKPVNFTNEKEAADYTELLSAIFSALHKAPPNGTRNFVYSMKYMGFTLHANLNLKTSISTNIGFIGDGPITATSPTGLILEVRPFPGFWEGRDVEALRKHIAQNGAIEQQIVSLP